MQIQVIGTGCTTCKNLYKTVKKIVNNNAIEATIEYSDDITKLVELGVMSSPVLIIDKEIIFSGNPLSSENLEKILLEKS